ncbi:hypothetical protein [Leptospira phage LE3]|uniref:Uncharacterized protein n=2 Tax=Nylescharonvirus TaxID=2843431 RepID=A0A343LEH2_9CAUD|nr:hypothetical protein HWB33_gp71 [Leptospira phage LE3]YP_009835544.1 hypothetical protein HWB34_gp69 [Leptospira phage LE4]ATN95006.1 hypothetical protein [Leptospira phage LE3]ATN95082.1 hypothetical protein [Leptospira phage LE4]
MSKKERNEAIEKAKRKVMSDPWIVCIVCGTIANLTPSHLLKIRARNNKPDDPKYIVPKCVKCHTAYELLNPEARMEFWKDKHRNDIVELMKEIM